VRNTTTTIATIIVGDRIEATKRLFPTGDRTQPKERGGEREGIREWHLFDPFGSPAESAKGSDRTALRPSLSSFLPFPFLSFPFLPSFLFFIRKQGASNFLLSFICFVGLAYQSKGYYCV
jgi:hypothetical protein